MYIFVIYSYDGKAEFFIQHLSWFCIIINMCAA